MCLLSCKVHGRFCHVTDTSPPSLLRFHPFLSKFPTERTLFGASATNAEIQHSFKKSWTDGSLVATMVKNNRRQTREVGKITSPDAVEKPGPEFGFKLTDFTSRYRSANCALTTEVLASESMSHQSASQWLSEACCKHLVSVDSLIRLKKRHEKQIVCLRKVGKLWSQENSDQHMGENRCNNNAQRCMLTKCQSQTKRSRSASANIQGTSQSSKPSVGPIGQ